MTLKVHSEKTLMLIKQKQADLADWQRTHQEAPNWHHKPPIAAWVGDPVVPDSMSQSAEASFSQQLLF